MLHDVAELPEDTVLRTDVCVIGGGAAGLDLALRLARDGRDVVVLESGQERFVPRIQDLYRVRSVGRDISSVGLGDVRHLPAAYRGEPRIRQLGGTTNVWKAKWQRLDDIDLRARDWVPDSGWPFDLDELAPFYDEIARDYGLPVVDGPQPPPPLGVAGRFGDPRLRPVWFYRERGAPSAAERFADDIGKQTRARVYLGANAVELRLTPSHDHVDSARFCSLRGRTFWVQARSFVVALGGLETPRLLLTSNRQLPAGIGNARDLVGRYYMDHPKLTCGVLSSLSVPAALCTRPGAPDRFHTGIALTDDVERAHRLLNHAVHLRPRERGRGLLRRGRADRASSFDLSWFLEQAPDPSSRLTLGDETDALGVPRLRVDWRFNDLDRQAFARTVGIVADVLRSLDDVELQLDAGAGVIEATVAASHPMGTTRMAQSPARGVVDENCRVYGTDNLFVASSAVFPTGGHQKPTFTILALARRLARHLLEEPARG